MIGLMIAGLFTASTLANGPASLTFANSSDQWGLIAQGSGRVATSNEIVEINLDKLSLLANPKFPSSKKIVGYTVCIIHLKSEHLWEQITCAPHVEHRITLQPGQVESVGASTFSIPLKRLPSTGDFWFAIDVEVIARGGQVGHIYAHSENLPWAGS